MSVRTTTTGTAPVCCCGGDVIVVDGDGVIVATRGAIVYHGDAGRVVANTGSAGRDGKIYLSAAPEDAPDVEMPLAPGTAVPLARAGLARIALGALSVEDQSVVVHGDDNRVSYDDAVIVVDRDGPVNISTGDTDSGGLNLIDTVDSVVTGGTCAAEGTEGSTGESDTDEPGATSVQTPVVRDDGDDQGDGILLRGVRVDGDRNFVVDDDGAIVVGGSGRLNVQIGDADTGGLLAMRTRRSQVTAVRPADEG